jgi:signal transduction histidine kinase
VNFAPTKTAQTGWLSQRLLMPLNLAAYITWLAISVAALNFQLLKRGSVSEWGGMLVLLAFLLLFVFCTARPLSPSTKGMTVPILLQALLVLLADSLVREGEVEVLLVIVATQLVMVQSARVVAVYLLVVNALVLGMWWSRYEWLEALTWLLQMVGFQLFATLTAHYADSSQHANAALRSINAELLATRHLLEESARAAERLKLSRELHDATGHSLTALKLNLARVARDPTLAQREEAQVAVGLVDEVLAQIRQVVSALRVHDGFDLRAALHALALPVPGTQIGVEVEAGLRVDDLQQAETLLRCAQEALTNALRHAHPAQIVLHLQRCGAGVELRVFNDGAIPANIKPGNGLLGMRERVAALGGTLRLEPTQTAGLLLVVQLPGEQLRSEPLARSQMANDQRGRDVP